jgi:hypothetical protein
MLKIVIIGVLCGVSLPALAGERSRSLAPSYAIARLIKDPASHRPAPLAGSVSSQPFMLPPGDARIDGLPQPTLTAEAARRSSNAVSRPDVWDMDAALPDATARAGGSYAVYDIMRDQRKPRHRGSPLSAALVLKLDGNDDSPAFSVGGGGVAAAMWRAVPR